ncbi:MAG: hypothetical protein ACRC11_22370, partial [Xenococcaceae cyanobacterium]
DTLRSEETQILATDTTTVASAWALSRCLYSLKLAILRYKHCGYLFSFLRSYVHHNASSVRSSSCHYLLV